MTIHIDIDDLSLFIQDEVSKISAILIKQNWNDKTAQKWSSLGYEKLMKFCLTDTNHSIEYRKKAITHTRRQLVAYLENHDLFEKNDDEKLDKLRQRITLDSFIPAVVAREQEVAQINSSLFGQSEELAPPARKTTP